MLTLAIPLAAGCAATLGGIVIGLIGSLIATTKA